MTPSHRPGSSICQHHEWLLQVALDEVDGQGGGELEVRASDLKIMRLSEQAVLPTRGTPGAAGLDLSAAESVVIDPWSRKLVRTHLAISTPPGTYARVAPRSGMILKNSIDIAAGVIDHDYRGNLGIILVNNSSVPFSVKVHDRVAQLMVERVCMSNVVEVQSLPPTERSGQGFGSTGVGAHPCRSGDRQCCSHQGGCCYASVVRALTTDVLGPLQDVSLPGDEAPFEVSMPTCVNAVLG